MIVGEQEARALIKPRPKSSHKGDYGSVLLIGGFYTYGGAIIMQLWPVSKLVQD